ncbi:MAG: hypothetical protein RIC95_12085 [Vicingaceae bacterium]
MKHLTKFRNCSLLIILSLLLFSCASTTVEKVDLETTLTANGPFFEGPNSLMADYKLDMQDLLQKEGYKPQDIKSVSINVITVSLLESDSLSADAFSSAALSIVSSNEGMTSIANLNPIETTSSQITLTTSDEADLAPFFKEGQFTLVLDWNFNEDDYRNELSSKIKMNLNVELKSK